MNAKDKCNSSHFENRLKVQFALRAIDFDASANWITDQDLIGAHTDMAGNPGGRALDLCCGTGQLGRALKIKGWNVFGLDICPNMLNISSSYFSTLQGSVEKIPFDSSCFQLAVCRQSFQFIEIKKALPEIRRVLASGGFFIVSLTTPFQALDQDWLYKIHSTKQPLLLKFYTTETLINELKENGFLVQESRKVVVRESITRWMNHAPELNNDVRQKVIEMVRNSPPAYNKLHRVKVIDGEVFEDWNWIVLKTVPLQDTL